jgi:hypothetical protein
MSTPATKVVTPTDLASSFFSAYDAHDVDAMVAMCSEDAQLRYVPMGTPGEGNARAVASAGLAVPAKMVIALLIQPHLSL